MLNPKIKKNLMEIIKLAVNTIAISQQALLSAKTQEEKDSEIASAKVMIEVLDNLLDESIEIMETEYPVEVAQDYAEFIEAIRNDIKSAKEHEKVCTGDC